MHSVAVVIIKKWHTVATLKKVAKRVCVDRAALFRDSLFVVQFPDYAKMMPFCIL